MQMICIMLIEEWLRIIIKEGDITLKKIIAIDYKFYVSL